MEESICARCGAPDNELEFLRTPQGLRYHENQSQCIEYQAKRIDQLEKKLADACKAISSVEATAEMLNAVVGRMLGD